jgi:putative ABC transport system permease protein
MLHRLAWSQLILEKRRLFAALAGMTFAVLLQLMQFGFRDALITSSTVIHSRLRADLMLVSPQFEYMLSTGSIPRRRLYQVLERPEVESIAPVYLSLAPFKNPATGDNKQIFVVGFDPDQVVLEVPSIIENVKYVKTPDVALYDELSRPNNFGPIVEGVHQHGSVVTEIGGRRMTIGGLFSLGASFSATGHLVTSDSTFRKMFKRPEGAFELGLIRLKPGTDIAATQQALIEMLPADVRVVTRDQFMEIERDFWNRNSPIGFIFLIGTFLGLSVGGVIVYQILYTDITDHLPQYATLKAMGYPDRYLYLVVLEEALILSVSGFPLGVGLAMVLYSVAQNATHLPIVMTVERGIIVFGLTLGMAALSCVVAMRKLRSADPAECF